jgi:hypothetical protein
VSRPESPLTDAVTLGPAGGVVVIVLAAAVTATIGALS